MKALTLLLSVLVLLRPGLSAQTPGSSGVVWQRIFDGRTTSGWRSFREKRFPKAGWVIQEGSLHHQEHGGGGDIVTEGTFADFELRFQWKVAAGANSGVIYRVSEGQPATWFTGPEYQILDDPAFKGAKASTTAASLYALYPARHKKLLPTGQWNSGRVVVREGTIEHWLNGVRVVRCRLWDADWKGRVSRSKFAHRAGFARLPRGHIALQDHEGSVWYRHLRLREFKRSAVVDLLSGGGLSAWSAHAKPGSTPLETWRLEETGQLFSSGQPTGYLRTKQSYTNFLLSLEWRYQAGAKPGANSGVLLRQTGPDGVWPRSIEVSLQEAHAGDLLGLGGMALAGEPARTHGQRIERMSSAERAADLWNRIEIELNGGDLEVRHNGRVVNRAHGIPEVAGHIGLRAQGSPVQFRHLQLLPLSHEPGGPTF